MRRLRLALFFFSLLATHHSVFGTDIKDVVGSAHWGGQYWFPSTLQWCLDAFGQTYLVTTPCTADTTTPVDELNEGADRILALGSRVIYVPLNPNPRAWYGYSNPPLQTSIFTNAPADRLRAIAQSRPYADLFQKNFTTFFLAIGDNVPICSDAPNHACQCGTPGCVEQPQYFGLEGQLGVSEYNWAPVLDGMAEWEKLAEKTAMKNLAAYLLANPAFVGKTFILADLEGDWELRTGFVGDDSYRPDMTRVQALRDWLNARQEGVDEARAENPTSGVRVFNAAEVNRVDWAIEGAHGATVTNDVLPFTHCDLYSYSHWDSPLPHQPEALTQHLDYIATKAPDSLPFGHSNVIVAEYGGGQNLDYCTPPYQCPPDEEGSGELQKEGMRRLTEAGLAWGSPLVVYWQLYDVGFREGMSVPRNVRPTNAQMTGLWLVPPDGTLRPIYSYFADLSTKGMLRCGLRTVNGHYVSADDAGGGAIHVNAPWLRTWEELTIIDRNGGSLVSGDSVNILTQNAHYVMALDNGGGATQATSTHDLTWERFTILKQNGSGAIVPGDTIALQAGSGHYFVAEGGGGGTNVLNANRTAIGPWEQFTIVAIPPTCSYAISPSQQAVAASGGSFEFTVTTAAGCGWTVSTSESWITITSALNWSGTSTVTYTVAPNSGTQRTGTITFADQQLIVTQSCVASPATITPSGPTSFCDGDTLTLTASNGASWLWSTGETTQAILVATSGDYTVRVTDGSGCSATSSPTTVTVTTFTPTITAGGATTFYQGGSVTLTATAGASYLWSTGATTQSILVTTTGDYTVTVTDGSGCTGTSAPTTVTVIPPAPNSLIATAVTATRVDLSWSFSGTADSFEIDRRSSGGGGYITIASTTTLAFSDMTATPNNAYLYRVRAVNSGVTSNTSNSDLATTVIFTDDPLIAGQTVMKAQHITQLRTAVNAVRTTAGLSPATFTDSSLVNVAAKAVHIEELRTALAAARSALALGAVSYGDPPPLAGLRIKRAHIEEIRGGVK